MDLVSRGHHGTLIQRERDRERQSDREGEGERGRGWRREGGGRDR